MRSLTWLAVAAGLTLLVGLSVPLAIVAIVALRDQPAERTYGPSPNALAAGPDQPAPAEVVQGPCRVVLNPGEDITATVAAQPSGAVVCLARGVHRPFVVNRTVNPGVIVRGEGETATIIQAQRGDGVAITDAERFTLAGVMVRGGTPAGVYAARTRGLALRGVRITSSAFGIHADDGAGVTLEDVTISGATDFGLLVRRRASVTAERTRVLESRGVGIGVTEGAAGLTLRASEIARTDRPGFAQALVLIDSAYTRLESVNIRGGSPAGVYAARVPRLELRDVSIEGSVYGVQADDATVAALEDVIVTGATATGVLVQHGATLTADRLRVLDSAGSGVSAVEGAAALTLRDSEITGSAGTALFAGHAGCAAVTAATLAVPPCFLEEPAAFVSTTTVRLERTSIRDSGGSGVVLFPGVQGEFVELTVERSAETALFAWGAAVTLSGGGFADNVAQAVEVRAYPDPRGAALRPAEGTIQGITIERTRSLSSGALGGGILAQGSRLVVAESAIRENGDAGISYQNGSEGEVRATQITGNDGPGLCLAPSAAVRIEGVTLTGNRQNAVNACGGRPE